MRVRVRVDMPRGRNSRRKPASRPPHASTSSGVGAGGGVGTARRADGTDGAAIVKIGGEEEERCVCCGDVHVDKFDTSLMCSLGHMTCFPCIAVNVQPHPVCSAHCNGFKFRCAECGTWSCVNKTQELAMLCGRHSIAIERLRAQRILREDFERPRICTCRDTSSEPDTPSEDDGSSEDEQCTFMQTRTGHDAALGAGAQLPRVCNIDWSHGHAQRAKRLERLRASLLGCNRVVRG